MNRIRVVDNKIEEINVSDAITYEFEEGKNLFDITKLKLIINKNSKLELINEFNNTKLEISILVNPSIQFDLYETKEGNDMKIQYKIDLMENSVINIDKLVSAVNNREMFVTNLNDVGAKVNYNFKSICDSKDHYDIFTYHNAKNTYSNIKNNAVNINDGTMSFHVSSFIPKGYSGCTANQSTRIINLTNNKCEIKPNLYIDEYDVLASHSALIGKFSLEEMFYLQSRGITEEDATNLLIKGFLTSDIENKKMMSKIEEIIKKYWR